MTILTQFYTLILALDVHDNSVKVRNFSEISVYFNCIFSEYTADFHKITTNLWLDIISNLRRIVMGIKHQNQGINLGQKCQKFILLLPTNGR